jgi:phosphoribosylformylglycinamidine synthase
MNFNKKGDTIYLMGVYTKHLKDKSSIMEILYDAISRDMVRSAHTLEKSGLFCGLIEACSIKKLGFDITGDAEMSDKDFLFRDKNSAILISISADKEGKFVDFCYNNSIPLTLLGHVTKGELRMDDTSFGYISDFIN